MLDLVLTKVLYQKQGKGYTTMTFGLVRLNWVASCNILAVSSFISKELDIDLPGAFSTPIRIHRVDGSLVILVRQYWPRWRETKLDENGPQVLGDLGGEHSCNKFTLGTASCDSRLKLRLEGDSTASEAKELASHRSTGAQVSGLRRVNIIDNLQEVRELRDLG
jgi:hypothetical protein